MHCSLRTSIFGFLLLMTCEAQQQSSEEPWRPLLKRRSRVLEDLNNTTFRQAKVSLQLKNLKSSENTSKNIYPVLLEKESHLLTSASDNADWRTGYSIKRKLPRRVKVVKRIPFVNHKENFRVLPAQSNTFQNLKPLTEISNQKEEFWIGADQQPVFVNAKALNGNFQDIKSSNRENNISILVFEGLLPEKYSSEEGTVNVASLGQTLENLLQNIPLKERKHQKETSSFQVQNINNLAPQNSLGKLSFYENTPVVGPLKYSTRQSSSGNPTVFDRNTQSLIIEIPSLEVGKISPEIDKFSSIPHVESKTSLNPHIHSSEFSIINLGGPNLPISEDVLRKSLSSGTQGEHTTHFSGTHQFNTPSEIFRTPNNDNISPSSRLTFDNKDVSGAGHSKYTELPFTNFRCRNYELPGYYADTETECKVFHICEPNKRQHDLMCPPGTIFSQALLTCDWPHKVQCSRSSDFFEINNQVYKPRPSSQDVNHK
ncbi:uncharacterized protein LOC143258657 [Tachypleus tridentatus]|uniref:uncharacterized protein LOC143258657 n=1 Tax=Tachypleus tridentatus TaxID=6853 RepID=UPI003FD5E7D3